MRAQQLATNPDAMSKRDLTLALAEHKCRMDTKKSASCPLVAYLEANKVRIQDCCIACLGNVEADLANRFSHRNIEVKAA